jgi:uncharacterized membrane protein
MDRLAKSCLGLAVLGIALAIYHAYDEVSENFSSCNINPNISCGNVFFSGHTTLFGVPFYILGLVWFPLLLVLGLWSVRTAAGSLRSEVFLPLLMVGNVFTLYLWYIELAVVGAICPVCVSLYVVNYLMTIAVAVAAFRQS